jgi:ElaB/YqjD/DUF883 family membrane-anchored ribosome-binding protein
MAEEPDVIREQIEETRTALTEKLETLEGQVRDTVQTAKETVEGTIENVKSSVQETVQTVKRTFDLRHQVDQHPWAMLGGSFLTGFVLGNYLEGRRQQSLRSLRGAALRSPDQVRPQTFPEGLAAYRPNGSRSAQALAAEPSQPGMLSRLLHTFDDEIAQVKEVAIGAALGVVRDMAKQSFPMLAPQINEVMNSATTKLGGQPVAGPLVEPSGPATASCTEESVRRPGSWQ